VEQAAAKRTVSELLAGNGIDVRASGPVTALQREIQALLGRAEQAGAVREDVGAAEVMALLAATSDAALRSEWDRDLQERALAVVFNGLRPA
jgi:hypothetical protein